MNDIILGGHSLLAVKKKREEMRRDAAKYISENLKKACEDFETLLQLRRNGTVNGSQLSDSIADRLESISIVSDVVGVKYCLPYNAEYDDDVMSAKLDDASADEELELYDIDYGRLEDVLCSMESQSEDWYSSKC